MISYFVKDFNFGSFKEIRKYSQLVYIPIYYSFVPVLSMMMHFLWLAYRKYEYKYTVIRWTWYIVIRILVVLLTQNLITLSLDYEMIYCYLVNVIYAIAPIIDFIQYVYYARKFYLHLKRKSDYSISTRKTILIVNIFEFTFKLQLFWL